MNQYRLPVYPYDCTADYGLQLTATAQHHECMVLYISLAWAKIKIQNSNTERILLFHHCKFKIY